jgi:hypothetical protein
MYFSPLEWPRVALTRPELRDAILAVGDEWEAAFPGQKLAVPAQGGYRAEGVQAAVYADSVTSGFRAAPAGQSAHEYGAAIDLKIVGVDQNADADQLDPRYRKLAEIAVRHGLRAGFYFTTGKPDPYHFELAESLDTMRAEWEGLKKKGSKFLQSSPSWLR